MQKRDAKQQAAHFHGVSNIVNGASQSKKDAQILFRTDPVNRAKIRHIVHETKMRSLPKFVESIMLDYLHEFEQSHGEITENQYSHWLENSER